MFRSISWQLQFSYGLLVLLALVGVGIFGYLHQKSEILRTIDSDLQFRSKRINSLLVRIDLDRRIAIRAGEVAEEDADGTPALPRPPRALEVPPERRGTIYYQVWRTEEETKELLYESIRVPDTCQPVPLAASLPRAGIVRDNQIYREHLSRALRNYVVLVGTDVSDDMEQLKPFLFRMILGECVFLVVFILAGFYMTRRALSPIGQISETARTIAGGSLDERIPVEGGSSELEGLALVLNESFDRLEGSFRRQQQFTSNASHELRTPITVILSEGSPARKPSRTIKRA